MQTEKPSLDATYFWASDVTSSEHTWNKRSALSAKALFFKGVRSRALLDATRLTSMNVRRKHYQLVIFFYFCFSVCFRFSRHVWKKASILPFLGHSLAVFARSVPLRSFCYRPLPALSSCPWFRCEIFLSNVNKYLAQENAVNFRPMRRHRAAFRGQVRSMAFVQLEVGENAASIQVRHLPSLSYTAKTA